MDILCDSCKYILGKKCELYNIPILHDTRFCAGYEKDNKKKEVKK
jgi:hypothetical protein